MIQSSSANPALLDAIVARLVQTFHPQSIYLFGSRARGDERDDSDYDFLVETDSVPYGTRINSKRMTWLDGFVTVEIQVHLRQPGELERRRNDPGYIDWDVAREGQLLYAAPGFSAIIPTGRVVRERAPKLPASLSSWVEIAEDDLVTARHLASDFGTFRRGICFHSQQAAEKYLKALAISRNRHPSRTHQLDLLLRELTQAGFALAQLGDDCEFLSPFAVETRYPGDSPGDGDAHPVEAPLNVTEEEARAALLAAERIIAAVKKFLP